MIAHVPLSRIDKLTGTKEGQTWSCSGGTEFGNEYTERLVGVDGLYHKTGRTCFVKFNDMVEEHERTESSRWRCVDTGTRYLGDEYSLFLESVEEG